jgi:hypothetical protein
MRSFGGQTPLSMNQVSLAAFAGWQFSENAVKEILSVDFASHFLSYHPWGILQKPKLRKQAGKQKTPLFNMLTIGARNASAFL